MDAGGAGVLCPCLLSQHARVHARHSFYKKEFVPDIYRGVIHQQIVDNDDDSSCHDVPGPVSDPACAPMTRVLPCQKYGNSW